jgi:hypothetical protein
VQFLRENYENRKVKEVTALFNDQFGTQLTPPQVRKFIKKRCLSSEWTGPTGFRWGDGRSNWRPVGTERLDTKGFIQLKISEPLGSRKNHRDGWVPKHVYIWEQTHGKVPSGMVVAFKSGNKLNCEIDNLRLLSRAELLRTNHHGYSRVPDELKPSIVALSKLEVRVFEHSKSKQAKR